MDNELLLFDRINIIKDINKKYDLENNAYISFSGGKDSTIIHYLFDMALPNNKIPRVFIDTGIEYNDIKEFVKEMAAKDDRFVIVKPSRSITKVLQEYGYPFKSKQHSHALCIYQTGGKSKSVRVYLREEGNNKLFYCPKKLEYQFTPEFKIKCSDKCCMKLKKEPAHKWSKENNKSITITGMRASEGGSRRTIHSCAIFNDNALVKFHPLIKVNEEWEDWFIEKEKIKICKLYYPPFNFKRTGCKGCPFALDLQEQLEIMAKYLPNERTQCEMIWKPVYQEYRRINYRLKKDEQIKLL